MKVKCLFLFITLVFSISLFAGEEDNIRKVFDYLKMGYEKKNTDFLARCFPYLPNDQLEAYTNIFSLTDDYQVNFNITNIYISPEGDIARVDALVNMVYYVTVLTHRERMEIKKYAGYLMYKKGDRWTIIGAKEDQVKNCMVEVNDQNFKDINELLKQIPVEDREKLFADYTIVNKEQNKMAWQGDSGAIRYVVSITKDDPTKTENTQLYWKNENIYATAAYIPVEIFDNLELGQIYFFNIFSYDKELNPVSGQIFKIKYSNDK